jgi:hypothetical protein
LALEALGAEERAPTTQCPSARLRALFGADGSLFSSEVRVERAIKACPVYPADGSSFEVLNDAW